MHKRMQRCLTCLVQVTVICLYITSCSNYDCQFLKQIDSNKEFYYACIILESEKRNVQLYNYNPQIYNYNPQINYEQRCSKNYITQIIRNRENAKMFLTASFLHFIEQKEHKTTINQHKKIIIKCLNNSTLNKDDLTDPLGFKKTDELSFNLLKGTESYWNLYFMKNLYNYFINEYIFSLGSIPPKTD